jgi:alpha-galactosidase
LCPPHVERREEWAAYLGNYGGLVTSSDRLSSVDEWGLDVTWRLLAEGARRAT